MVVGRGTTRWRTASVAASRRECTWSLVKMLCTWVRTVFRLMPSRAAIGPAVGALHQEPEHLSLARGELGDEQPHAVVATPVAASRCAKR